MTENAELPESNVFNSTVSIKVLGLPTRNLISSLLNPLKVLPNEDGIPRDWRGLAHLIGFKVEKVPVIACDTDPTARVLILWQKKENPPYTVKQLLEFLVDLDRFDIIDDTTDLIAQNINDYLNEPEKSKYEVSILDDVDRHILTIDDVNNISNGLNTQKYDAFVVFADEDIDFATELIETMEKRYGFKLCVKERDLVAGLHFEHKAIVELISERCNRLIVIISPAYLKSAANKFVVNYAQALGIEQGKRKIIPCLYETCDLPLEIRHTFALNYMRSGKLFNFWDRLRDSIQSPSILTPPPSINIQRPVSLDSKDFATLQDLKLKPALVQSQKNQLKPKKESVKFGCCTNLQVNETSNNIKRSVSANVLHSEPPVVGSADLIDGDTRKHKNWFMRLVNQKKGEKKTVACNKTVPKDKKKQSWLKKIKVPVIN